MTAPALDLAPKALRNRADRATSAEPARTGTSRRTAVRRPRPASARSSAPLARPLIDNGRPAPSAAPRLRPSAPRLRSNGQRVESGARSCRGEAAVLTPLVDGRRIAAPAPAMGWQLTDRALALIIGVLAAVLLAAAAAVVTTAVSVTSAQTAGATANTATVAPAPAGAASGAQQAHQER